MFSHPFPCQESHNETQTTANEKQRDGEISTRNGNLRYDDDTKWYDDIHAPLPPEFIRS